MNAQNSSSGNSAAQVQGTAMIALSSSSFALVRGIENGSLRVERVKGRYGDYFTVSDDCGLIEVAMNKAEVDARIEEIKRRLAS
jgi:hypothetical protein